MQAKALALRGKLLLGGSWVEGALVVREGRVAEIARGGLLGGFEGEILEGAYVAPGLVDLQVNGGFGEEVGEDPAALARLAARLPETGVTAFLPTRVTGPVEAYPAPEGALDLARRAGGAMPLGWHLEGPFLSPSAAGAHHAPFIEAADCALFERLLAEPSVKLVTLAPERAAALEKVRRLREAGVVVSLGHTAASFEQITRGADAGARMATHLYSAMSPFHHRAPGAVGAVLTDERLVAGLIADGVHAHPAALRLALRAKGKENIALVTDAMSAAGKGPGVYALAGKRVLVDGESARLEDGTLAGSVLTMDRAVRNMVELAGASLEDALEMASAVPARVLGLERKGRLEVGLDADVVLLGERAEVLATVVAGEVAFRRGASPLS